MPVSVTPATASFLLIFNSSWPKTEHTSHVTVFYKASGQTVSPRHGEKVPFGMNATRCCQGEQTRAVQQRLCLLTLRGLALRGHRAVEMSIPSRKPASGAPCLQYLQKEKETFPVECRRKKIASQTHTGLISKSKAMLWFRTIAAHPKPKGHLGLGESRFAHTTPSHTPLHGPTRMSVCGETRCAGVYGNTRCLSTSGSQGTQ